MTNGCFKAISALRRVTRRRDYSKDEFYVTLKMLSDPVQSACSVGRQ